ncbi:hypothetical protein T07_2616 [Trichinella nelsoni]|uniref:Integrase catalytic domain-containing protein n=1 Tax=Trichinella nelsoni TaxID=6336 RepID=A0A0V0SH03_9BILA|nr:hypothetical protein T07_2616 [Trichinella nelsoni]
MTSVGSNSEPLSGYNPCPCCQRRITPLVRWFARMQVWTGIQIETHGQAEEMLEVFKGCKGAVWTDLEVTAVIDRQDHVETCQPIPAIYDEESSAASAEPSTSGQFPVFKRVRAAMYKHQAKRFHRLPDHRHDLVIPDQFKTTKSGEDFLLWQSNSRHILVLATGSNIRLMATRRTWALDGTFKVVPQCWHLWHSGPRWLQLDESAWPNLKVGHGKTPEKVELESRKTALIMTNSLDFAGPILARSDGKPLTLLKTYVCVFTCMVVRAIHLELVPEMTVDSFLRALRRFIARRGRPWLLQSDNFQTFYLASRFL